MFFVRMKDKVSDLRLGDCWGGAGWVVASATLSQRDGLVLERETAFPASREMLSLRSSPRDPVPEG
jgi:hypothetical protein